MCSNSSLLSAPSDWAFFGMIQEVPSFTPSVPSAKNTEDMLPALENMFQKWFSEDDVSTDKCFTSEKRSSRPQDKQFKLLGQLLKGQKKLSKFPNFCPKLEKMLKQEISRVWEELNIKEEQVKEEEKIVHLVEKIYVSDEIDDNFVGRLLGVRGQKIKQLAKCLGVSISIRGQGGPKGPVSEEKFKKQLFWGDFDDTLHVVIKCTGKESQCKEKLAKAVEVVREIMVQPVFAEPKTTVLTGKCLDASKQTLPLVTLTFVE